MARASSLKKAVRQIIEHTERVLDEHTANMMDTPPQHSNMMATPAVSSSSVLPTTDTIVSPPLICLQVEGSSSVVLVSVFFLIEYYFRVGSQQLLF